jgi:hypothetical protein
VAALPGDTLLDVGTSGLAGFSTAQLRAMTADQLGRLSDAQAQMLGTEVIGGLGNAPLAGLLGPHGLDRLGVAQIQALSTAQMAALGEDVLQASGTAAIVALTTAQVAALGSGQLTALSIEQIAAMETQDVAAIALERLSALSAAQLQALSGDQLDALIAATPIMLDLDGLGLATVSARDGARFDLLANGRPQTWGWVGRGDALLARDLDGNGLIDDGRELFGSATLRPDGTRHGHGYAALAALDDNGDGLVSAADAAFGQLRLWTDEDVDGRTDPGELRTLGELGVAALDLAHRASAEISNGNALALVGRYLTSDGQWRDMADVWFGRLPDAPAGSAGAGVPPLGDLLAAPHEESPAPHATGPPAAGPAASASPATPIGPVPRAEDELNPTPPMV